MANALVVPESRDLEALSPNDRWNLEDQLNDLNDHLREYNDEELRRWVTDGKTQTWIAKQVGRTQARISQRCSALGIEIPKGKGTVGGRPSGEVISANNSDEPELVEGEVVDPERPRHLEPYSEIVADAEHHENPRVMVTQWFEWGAWLRNGMDEQDLTVETKADLTMIKKQAGEMEALAKRVRKEVKLNGSD